MAGAKIRINIESYIKDRYWHGWWWDRSCLYDHAHDRECKACQYGKWHYTSPKKTNMKFGEALDDHQLYVKGRVYMYADTQHPKGRKE